MKVLKDFMFDSTKRIQYLIPYFHIYLCTLPIIGRFEVTNNLAQSEVPMDKTTARKDMTYKTTVCNRISIISICSPERQVCY